MKGQTYLDVYNNKLLRGSLVTTLLSNRTSKSSRGFSLAWFLAFTESFTGLVCRVVGLFTSPWFVYKPRE